jgi:hypothetical protein
MSITRCGFSSRQAAIISVAFVAISGCARKRSSEIVRILEKAGAGDLSAASVGSMTHWMEQRPALALQLNDLCAGVRKGAMARWPETTEGRACEAVSRVAGYIIWQRTLEESNDHRIFQGGSR